MKHPLETDTTSSVYYGFPFFYAVVHKQQGMRMVQCSLFYLLTIRMTAVSMGATGTTLSVGFGVRRCEISGAFIIWEKPEC